MIESGCLTATTDIFCLCCNQNNNENKIKKKDKAKKESQLIVKLNLIFIHTNMSIFEKYSFQH